MKKIRIIRGAYGYQPKADGKKKVRRTVAVLRGETIEVTDAEAKRLVELGVAEYAAKEAAPEQKEDGKTPEQKEDGKSGIGEISLPPVPGLNTDGVVQ